MSKSGKGSQFERKICKILSLWWSGGSNEDVFWRSQNSGGRATYRARRGGKVLKGQDSDISAIHKSGRKFLKMFTVELKRGYSKSSFYDVLDKPRKGAQQKWEEWIEQIHESHTRSGTVGWILIHQRDRREPILFYSFSLWDKFFNNLVRLKHPTIHANVTIQFKKNKEKVPIVVMGCPLGNFLKAIKPEDIKARYLKMKSDKINAEKSNAKEFPKTQKAKNKVRK